MESTTPGRPPEGLDACRYSLFINAAPHSELFVAELSRTIEASHLEHQVPLVRKSPQEMKVLFLDAVDTVPDAILEKVVAGSTSAFFQFATATEILAELTTLASQRREVTKTAARAGTARP
jgi:hypothetical protein